ncbi:MAG TPA: amino acid adenylation domain-containing protein [Longimicrobium sp.]|nr:amino acid adenylation domain-containing protein [Longimicrobium sp.]
MTQTLPAASAAAEEAYLFPISFAQRRLWFLDQLLPGNPMYNVPLTLDLDGPLDLPALRRALQTMVDRHESLRTRFGTVEGEPVQIVLPSMTLELPIIDLRHLPPDERQAELDALVMREARYFFDMRAEPLIRTVLIRTGDERHVLALNIHHVITDGWSLGVMYREIEELYRAFHTGTEPNLPELTVQYPDYTVWQRDWLQGEALERQLSYWRKQLAGVPVMELPTDYPRPAQNAFRGETQKMQLEAPLAAALQEFSRREGMSLFMVLLAAFDVMLSRYSGQKDIVVGSPIANRTRPELEPLIGFFVNTLVLRTDLSGDPTFRELMARVRTMTVEAQHHQDVPFEALVDAVQPVRDTSRNPLFQVMFVLQNRTADRLNLPDMRSCTIRYTHNETAKFDLWLSVTYEGDELGVTIEYNTELTDPSTGTRMLAQYRTLLEGILEDPDRRVSQLPLLPADERRRVLEEWNDTAADYPRDACIHQLVEAQVERTPDRVAVTFGEQEVTYAELNRRANRLARHLRARGVAPGDRIGVCMERAPEVIVGLLAILKAGGAYVPLDPANPDERLAFMAGDSRCPVLLTQTPLRARLPADGAQVVCMDADGAAWAGEDDSNLGLPLPSSALAYVTYTSGSTGRPKGVAMAHRPLVNLLVWQLGQSVDPSTAQFLQFASLGFDVSYQEIFPTLASGGTVVMITEETRKDPLAVMRILGEGKADRLYIPVVMLQQLAQVCDEYGVAPKTLREITVSGEQLQITKHVVNWFKALDGCRLNNFYGPTESHAVTAYRLGPDPDRWPTLVPIGTPIANTQILILDPELNPTPIGVPGELYIGGDCLAHGYLNRPELTAQKFVPHPYPATPGARLYRTGDLARWRADGELEFLGRIDFQVKIRGFRVELEEIESTLKLHESVKECVVIAREDVPGDKRLVGYVVPREGYEVSGPALRSFLRERLPEHMVPAAFVALEKLPLTINGKTDRKALPAPEGGKRDVAANYVAPATSTEEAMAAIWAEVLRLERVGTQDAFFELGGHSLMVTQVLSRVRSRLGVELAVRDFFVTPTVQGLAAKVDEVLLARAASAGDDELANLLAMLEGMDEDAAQELLAGEGAAATGD